MRRTSVWLSRGLFLVVDGLMMLMYVDVFDGRFFGLLKQGKGDAHEHFDVKMMF